MERNEVDITASELYIMRSGRSIRESSGNGETNGNGHSHAVSSVGNDTQTVDPASATSSCKELQR